jgi:outer membrane lipoprotein-sorting protein
MHNAFSGRRSMALVLITALAMLIPALVFAGHPAAGTDDSAKKMLQKSSKALGEDKPWKTRVEKGLETVWDRTGWGELRADYTRWIVKPDKLKIDRDNSAYDHPFFRTYYYSGGDAWYVVNLVPGRSPQLAANLKQLLERVDGIAYYVASCDTFFATPSVPDDSLLAGAPLERVGCVLDGDTTLFDLNRKTHLPARRIENKGKRAYIFDDYRNTDGRLVPFHVTVYDDGQKSNDFLWSEVLFDQKIDDSIFEENRPPQPPEAPK